MNLAQLEEQLHRESFHHTYVWEDGPDHSYPDHTHPVETAHIILEGEMTVTMGDRSRTYRAGERCDVPAGAVHAAEDWTGWLPLSHQREVGDDEAPSSARSSNSIT